MLLIDNPTYAACTTDPPLHIIADGRKIQVGDCALFQAGNAPPFIGIIRRVSTDKEDCLKLCVTWLYRPADVNLANGLLLEAAPNEVFYSSHKDIIAIASLLHPCKVAFLGKGVELPSGISSFVCRRFYDIDNKCLWWLTDQSYIKKRREELDQLLDKTRQEMHATVQPGGLSPKRLKGPTSAQQLTSTPESLQNNGTTFSSKIKGKKRGRGDQGMEAIKRERILKAEDGDSVRKSDNVTMKVEITKITEEGALITTDGVEKLVQLMLVDNNGKLDLAGRVLFADVIAATDRIDCLNKFVQIRGLPILDEWLQMAHKGKTGDGSSPKETDKAVDEFVLSLLRALDKLPVNLNALQTCNIGKSVNHLRSSKNLEIQKKARGLVDTWKKRVDAEIKTIDTKTVGSSQAVSWSVKPGFTEIAYTGNRRTDLADISMKSSITQQSISKVLPGKCVPADGVVNPTTLMAGSPKLHSSSTPAAINSKAVCGSGSLDPPHVIPKEEKCSSSNQSQNNSQPRSSDHAKTICPSLKDARSSTARSVKASMTHVGSSHPKSSSNGHMANCVSGGKKYSSKSGSVSKTSVVDKVSQSVPSCERIVDMSVSDHGSSHRFIVRLPNPNRSPARSISGSSLEDPSAGSRASSPDLSDKLDHGDDKEKTSNNAGRNDISANLNAESWQSNDVKEGFAGYDDGDGSPTVIPKEDVRGAVEAGNAAEISRTSCSSSGNERGTAFSDPKRNSFSSMNALAESCAKYSEASTPLQDRDDVGMNLLASVAAGEMPNSDLVSPATSPGSSVKEYCVGSNEPKTRFSYVGAGSQILSTSGENTDSDSRNDGNGSRSLSAKDQIQVVVPKFTFSDKKMPLLLEGIKEELKRENVDQNKYTQVVNGQVRDDFTVKLKERNLVGQTKSSDHVFEKTVDGCMHTSDSDNKLRSFCVGESSVREHPLDKIEHGLATLTGQQPPSITEVTTETVEGDCQDTSDMNASAEEHNGTSSSTHVLVNVAETIERKGSLESCIAGSVGNDELAIIPREAKASAKKEEFVSVVEATSFITIAEQDAGAKLDFDLNEGLAGEDVNQSEPVTVVAPGSTATAIPSLPPFISPIVLSNSPVQKTIAAPAKGPFLPPENLLKCKGEPGWKGSAATSAFRPAEPRKLKFLDTLINADVQLSNSAMAKRGHPQLDIDLNVPDERFLDDLASENSLGTMESESGVINSNILVARAIGGLDLDLNRVDEDGDNSHCSFNSSCKLKVSPLLERTATDIIAHGEVNMSREFDLNNRPIFIEVGAEPVIRRQMPKNLSNVSFVPSITALRMDHADAGNGWFPAGNSYPAVPAPFLPDRGGSSYPIVAAAGAQTILRSAAGSGAYGSDVYRGPVLPSSPAMSFSPGATSLPYAGFSFGSTFPLASTCFASGPTAFVDSSPGNASYFPPIFSQLVGPAGAMPSPYPRPYVISLPDNNPNGGTESNRKWVRQGLDLNTGPGSTEELKEDRILPLSSRQSSVSSSHILMEDQARLYQLGTGGGLKRKAPGDWETERFNYSRFSWQ